MGYCIRQINASFKIIGGNKAKALEALKKINDDMGPFGWCDDIKECTNLKEALWGCRWAITEEYADSEKTSLEDVVDGNFELDPPETKITDVVDIEFGGEKLGDDETILTAIAPFVEDGSFIEIHGEDGDRWRWCFEKGELVTKQGKIVFD